jgi:putative molybdopterin biosynthesis protein
MPQKYLTVNEVADLLQMSKSHLFTQVRQGKIPAIRLGRAIRFDPEVLQAWLQGQTIQG